MARRDKNWPPSPARVDINSVDYAPRIGDGHGDDSLFAADADALEGADDVEIVDAAHWAQSLIHPRLAAAAEPQIVQFRSNGSERGHEADDELIIDLVPETTAEMNAAAADDLRIDELLVIEMIDEPASDRDVPPPIDLAA